MKNIIITGASGLVATELVLLLQEKTDFNLFLLSTNIEQIKSRHHGDRVRCFTIEEFSHYLPQSGKSFDFCLHTAFARSSDGRSLVESLLYQRTLLELVKQNDVKHFVNISSQSIYGKRSTPLWEEDTPPDPDYLYAFGKYTSCLMTELMLQESKTKWLNVRLCSVCENARFMRIFVQNVIEGKPIHLTAPDQHCSFIDVRDVATALYSLLDKAENAKWNRVYNLGANIVNSIREVADVVKRVGEKEYGLKNVTITEEQSDNHVRIGMDASLFMRTFDWKPEYDMEKMIRSLFEMLINVNGGGYPRSWRIVYDL